MAIKNEDIVIFVVLLYAWFNAIGVVGLALSMDIKGGLALLFTMLTWSPLRKIITKILGLNKKVRR
jgi:hypothetical protein